MMIKKEYEGIRNASPVKRYKNFINTVADREKVWLLQNDEGEATLDINDVIYILVWPRKEFCEPFASEDEKIISLEVHDFLKKCSVLEDYVQFMVFPTEKDVYSVSAKQLSEDITRLFR